MSPNLAVAAAIPELSSVLASTDFSDAAKPAIAYAYAAVDEGGTVHLVHVLELALSPPSPLYAHYTPGHALTPEQRERLHADCEARLRALVPAEAESRRIRTDVHVVDHPDVAAAVTRRADELGVALVCIASHGRTGLVKALLGSVAERVLAHSHCPVLVVRSARARS